MPSRWLFLFLLALWAPQLLFCDVVVIDFESFNDLDALTTQIPGLIFSHATVVSAGFSLNDLEFPPRSGTNSVFDDGGPLHISFGTPLSSFAGYFTYAKQLSLVAFDAANNQVGTAQSLFNSNDALIGDAGS